MRVLTIAVMCVALAACGSSGSSSGTPPLTVSAAASLKKAFTELRRRSSRRPRRASRSPAPTSSPRRSEQGVKPDVFASANTKLPDAALRQGPGREAGGVRRQPARARGARRRREGAARWPTWRSPGVTIAIGLGVRAGRHLHAQGARQAARRRASKAILGQRALQRARRRRRRRQAHPGRGRRRLRLHHRRRGGRRQAEGDRAARRRCSRTVAYGVAVVKGAKHPQQAQGVHRRAARTGEGGRRCRRPASCRRPRERTLVRGRCWCAALAVALAFLVAAGGGDLRRRRPGRARRRASATRARSTRCGCSLRDDG